MTSRQGPLNVEPPLPGGCHRRQHPFHQPAPVFAVGATADPPPAHGGATPALPRCSSARHPRPREGPQAIPQSQQYAAGRRRFGSEPAADPRLGSPGPSAAATFGPATFGSATARSATGSSGSSTPGPRGGTCLGRPAAPGRPSTSGSSVGAGTAPGLGSWRPSTSGSTRPARSTGTSSPLTTHRSWPAEMPRCLADRRHVVRTGRPRPGPLFFYGSKIHLVRDGKGLPMAVTVTAGPTARVNAV